MTRALIQQLRNALEEWQDADQQHGWHAWDEEDDAALAAADAHLAQPDPPVPALVPMTVDHVLDMWTAYSDVLTFVKFGGIARGVEAHHGIGAARPGGT